MYRHKISEGWPWSKFFPRKLSWKLGVLSWGSLKERLRMVVVTIIVPKKIFKNNYCSQRTVLCPSSQPHSFIVFNIYWPPRILTLCGKSNKKLKIEKRLTHGYQKVNCLVGKKHYTLLQSQLINLINNDVKCSVGREKWGFTL